MNYFNKRTDAVMMPSTFRWDARAGLNEREIEIMKYAPLVMKVVNKYNRDESRIGVFDKHDLIQSGFVGLVEGYDRIIRDESNKVNVNYLEMNIKGTIDRTLTYQSTGVVIPEYQLQKSKAEIVADRIISAWKYGFYNKAFSLDEMNQKAKNKTYMDTIPNVDVFDMSWSNEELNEDLSDLMWELMPREREVINMSYGVNMPKKSMKEMEEIFELSRMQISRIKKSALIKMKESNKSIYLQRFL